MIGSFSQARGTRLESQEIQYMTEGERELIELTQHLLDSIATGDWEAYLRLCDPTLTAFEPEARGHLVSGMAFHKFYFELDNERPPPVHTTMSAPHVRMLGQDAAVVSYIRLIQHLDRDGQSRTARFEETRVWQRQDGQWQNVHFHRSDNGAS
jgi:calcium/calmodulin-dependent protein kinase (CaM kinase) II